MSKDPSGHRPVGDEDMQPKPSCAGKPSKSAISRMDNLPISNTSYMYTYTVANIALQKGPPPAVKVLLSTLWNQTDYYTSKGPAKITDAEMETVYGGAINNGDNNYGLGLRTPGSVTPNQNDLTVAVTAMSTRIQVRLDKCQATKFTCTPTDIFLTAALGGDNGIAPGDLRDLGNGKVYGQPNSNTGIFQWGNYLSDPGLDNPAHNFSVIQQFVDNVNYLQQQGAMVPEINWTYICDLLKK